MQLKKLHRFLDGLYILTQHGTQIQGSRENDKNDMTEHHLLVPISQGYLK